MDLYSVFEAWDLRDRVVKELRAWVEKHPNAESLGKEECVKCALCCLKRPCIPTPEEIQKIADHLGMSVEELAKTKFIADTFGEDDEWEKTWFLIPARTDQEPGTRMEDFRDGYSTAPCVFLNTELHCTIHDVKPEQAKRSDCWIDRKEPDNPRDLSEVKAWTCELGESLLDMMD